MKFVGIEVSYRLPVELRNAGLQNVVSQFNDGIINHDKVLWLRRHRKIITKTYLSYVISNYGMMLEGKRCPVPLWTTTLSKSWHNRVQIGASTQISNMVLENTIAMHDPNTIAMDRHDGVLFKRRIRKIITVSYIGQIVQNLGGRLL